MPSRQRGPSAGLLRKAELAVTARRAAVAGEVDMRVIMGFAKKETPQSPRTRREGCSSGAGTQARCTLARCCATLKHTLTAFEKGNGITGLFL